jgi:type II secretory pathway pseudopilin PulG
MDVRARWLQMQSPVSTNALELLVCLAIMGAMIGVAAQGAGRVMQHLDVMEAVSLVAGAETALMEYRAVTGAWPSANERASFLGTANEKGSLAAVQAVRSGGAVDFALSARAGSAAGKILTIGAWQSAGAGDLPIVWICGHGSAPAPMTAASEDRTTLSEVELPSPCRKRRQ